MSAPISHLVYAHNYLLRRTRTDESAFIAGSVFPDIRYMGTVTREQTHKPNVYTTADMLETHDDWTAGTIHHNLVDDAWNAYIGENAPEIAGNPVAAQALKMLEDEFLYSQITEWLPIRVALRVVPNAEQTLVEAPVCLKWHSLLNKLVVAPPQRERRESFLREVGFDDEQLIELEVEVKKLRINSNTPNLLKGLSEHIGEALMTTGE